MANAESKVVLFDGVCNVCNASVNFIIDRDPAGVFQFASLQSPVGAALAGEHGIRNEVSTMVLIEDGVAYTRSTAALRMARHLRGPVRWVSLLLFVPRPVRDVLYRFFAANRYRWFGQSESCRIPTPDIRTRFLIHGGPLPPAAR
jgi:predicted DCC family thiol-disulfide oxidoreductase YuxK